MKCLVFARILFFASLLKLLYAFNGSIEIERRDINYTNGKTVYRSDTFKIPSTMCSSDISVYCGVMGGHSVGGCKCECNSEETTFGFYDNQWKCTANSKVHQHGGCSLILLSDRKEDSALITVPFSMEVNITYEMPTNRQRCYIIPKKSTYLLCDGSWKILENNFVYSRFSIAERDKTQFFTFHRTKKGFWYNEVKGRILRITIGCYDGSNPNIPEKCLLLKMQGTMKCPLFSLPPLPTTPPWTIPPTSATHSIRTSISQTTTVPTTPPTSATSTSANELQTHSIRTSLSQTTTVPTTPPTSATGTSGNELQTHSIRTSLSSQTTAVESPSFFNKRKKNAAEENDGGNTGLIVGVAVGVIGLTLIIIAIVIVKRRRTKRNAAVPESSTTVENISYDLGADNSLKITDYDGNRSLDQDEYSYAYANAVPLDRRNMSNGPPNNQGPQIIVSSHVNGKAQGLDKHGSLPHPSAAPASNILEAPVYAEVKKPKRGVKKPSNSDGSNKKGVNPQKSVDSQKEPLYNVLEDPRSINEPLEGREPPCYQVLEGPFSEDAPVYNVLEQPPSSDDPVYRSLDGRNPSVYSTLNRGDDTKDAAKQARNYNDNVYDCVGEVINDTPDIYQELNQNDGMNKDVY